MFTPHQLKVLAALFSRPDDELSLADIGRVLGRPPGAIQRGVNSLEAQGILRSRRQGNQRLFSLNTAYALLPEIRSIVRKTGGAAVLLRDMLSRLKGVKLALIYGSFARDALRRDSDIDLLVVGNAPSVESALLKRLPVLERQLQREINYTLYGEKEFLGKRASRDPFIEQILSAPRILLKGEV